jgi:hypothetical protein
MSDSIWKKDLSFRRKKVDDLPETAESLRVKELAFQRKLAEAAQAAALPAVEAPKAAVASPVAAEEKSKKKQSIWKKEIGGRKKAEVEPAAPEQPAPVVEAPAPVLEIAPAPVAVAPPTPVLDVPVEGLLASSPFASGESIWKKEISFRRKGDQGEEQPKSESIWNKDISLRRSQARSAQIRALADEALRQVDAAAQPEPWLAGPELPPEPAPEPEPVAPAQATEAASAKPKKASIWKRELGKPKASKEKEPKAGKARKPKKEKAPKARKPKTRLRDVKISLPKPAPKAHTSGGSHAVKRLVGLKIGASQLAAARVSNNGAAELVQVARQPLEQGVVVGGEVRDPEGGGGVG